MPNVSTNLMSALLNNESIDEGFRVELENAVNDLFSTEPQFSLITRNMILSEYSSAVTPTVRPNGNRLCEFTRVMPSNQTCWIHICRNVMKHVRAKGKRTVMSELKEVYQAKTKQEAENILFDFMKKYQKVYPKVISVLEDLTSLFTFYRLLAAIRRSVYTTNLIGNLKRGTKRKEQFPNEETLERFVCTFYSDYNLQSSSRAHHGFKQCRAELEAVLL